MANAAKISAPSNLELPEETEDPYERRCLSEFGQKAIIDAGGTNIKPGLIRGWAKLNWSERYDALKNKMEIEEGWA